MPARPETAIYGVEKITGLSAQVKGAVRPGESETRWRLEYTTSEAGSWLVVSTGVIPAAEAGFEFQTIDADLTGLRPATTYFVRLFAENVDGHVFSPLGPGDNSQFETAGPPEVVTFAVHAIHGEAMRGLGSVRPHGYDTHYHFEYVTQGQFETGGFAEESSTPELDAGSGELPEIRLSDCCRG